ncbi:MAG TPA: histidine phosphatase family protein [Methylomirabilota bacterium]|jgi:broad specificity phosphatase PhoE|nr:histidine phosphatase family protein [Methylomirabilota bacterium]
MDGRRIYLMRHGETLYQSEAQEGAIGNGALTERGREQIAAAALLFRGVQLDRVYASPLARAQETARIIAQEHGLEVLVSPDLREITPNEPLLVGRSIADIFHEVRRFFTASDITWDEAYLGGESFRQVQERGVRFLHSLLSQEDWRTILVVAHGGFNNALLAYATGMTSGRLFNIEQDFGCINIIDFIHGRPFLRLANFTLYDQLKIKLRTHSLDVILTLLQQKGIV